MMKRNKAKEKSISNKNLDEQSLMYLRAKHEWDERIGSAISSAHSWKILAFAAILTTACSVGGIAYIGSQSKIQPFALKIQGDDIEAMQPLSAAPRSMVEALRRANIRTFITSVRTVYTDVDAMRQQLKKGMSFLQSVDPAYIELVQNFKKESPFERSQTEVVKVKKIIVLPLSHDSYQAQWTEVVSDLHGEVLKRRSFEATLETYMVMPKKQQALVQNPLGFFIKRFNIVEI